MPPLEIDDAYQMLAEMMTDPAAIEAALQEAQAMADGPPDEPDEVWDDGRFQGREDDIWKISMGSNEHVQDDGLVVDGEKHNSWNQELYNKM